MPLSQPTQQGMQLLLSVILTAPVVDAYYANSYNEKIPLGNVSVDGGNVFMMPAGQLLTGTAIQICARHHLLPLQTAEQCSTALHYAAGNLTALIQQLPPASYPRGCVFKYSQETIRWAFSASTRPPMESRSQLATPYDLLPGPTTSDNHGRAICREPTNLESHSPTEPGPTPMPTPAPVTPPTQSPTEYRQEWETCDNRTECDFSMHRRPNGSLVVCSNGSPLVDNVCATCLADDADMACGQHHYGHCDNNELACSSVLHIDTACADAGCDAGVAANSPCATPVLGSFRLHYRTLNKTAAGTFCVANQVPPGAIYNCNTAADTTFHACHNVQHRLTVDKGEICGMQIAVENAYGGTNLYEAVCPSVGWGWTSPPFALSFRLTPSSCSAINNRFLSDPLNRRGWNGSAAFPTACRETGCLWQGPDVDAYSRCNVFDKENCSMWGLQCPDGCHYTSSGCIADACDDIPCDRASSAVEQLGVCPRGCTHVAEQGSRELFTYRKPRCEDPVMDKGEPLCTERPFVHDREHIVVTFTEDNFNDWPYDNSVGHETLPPTEAITTKFPTPTAPTPMPTHSTTPAPSQVYTPAHDCHSEQWELQVGHSLPRLDVFDVHQMHTTNANPVALSISECMAALLTADVVSDSVEFVTMPGGSREFETQCLARANTGMFFISNDEHVIKCLGGGSFIHAYGNAEHDAKLLEMDFANLCATARNLRSDECVDVFLRRHIESLRVVMVPNSYVNPAMCDNAPTGQYFVSRLKHVMQCLGGSEVRMAMRHNSDTDYRQDLDRMQFATLCAKTTWVDEHNDFLEGGYMLDATGPAYVNHFVGRPLETGCTAHPSWSDEDGVHSCQPILARQHPHPKAVCTNCLRRLQDNSHPALCTLSPCAGWNATATLCAKQWCVPGIASDGRRTCTEPPESTLVGITSLRHREDLVELFGKSMAPLTGPTDGWSWMGKQNIPNPNGTRFDHAPRLNTAHLDHNRPLCTQLTAVDRLGGRYHGKCDNNVAGNYFLLVPVNLATDNAGLRRGHLFPAGIRVTWTTPSPTTFPTSAPTFPPPTTSPTRSPASHTPTESPTTTEPSTSPTASPITAADAFCVMDGVGQCPFRLQSPLGGTTDQARVSNNLSAPVILIANNTYRFCVSPPGTFDRADTTRAACVPCDAMLDGDTITSTCNTLPCNALRREACDPAPVCLYDVARQQCDYNPHCTPQRVSGVNPGLIAVRFASRPDLDFGVALGAQNMMCQENKRLITSALFASPTGATTAQLPTHLRFSDVAIADVLPAGPPPPSAPTGAPQRASCTNERNVDDCNANSNCKWDIWAESCLSNNAQQPTDTPVELLDNEYSDLYLTLFLVTIVFTALASIMECSCARCAPRAKVISKQAEFAVQLPPAYKEPKFSL